MSGKSSSQPELGPKTAPWAPELHVLPLVACASVSSRARAGQAPWQSGPRPQAGLHPRCAAAKRLPSLLHAPVHVPRRLGDR